MLADPEVLALVRRVFSPRPADRALAILVDLPDAVAPDRPAWRWRRETAAAWAAAIDRGKAELGLDAVHLYAYPNVHRANADLPATLPRDGGGEEALDDVLRSHAIVIALTEMSATAPLKVAARRIPFRAATMPGFTEAMVPALRLDYVEIDRRVTALKRLLDDATGADVTFRVDGRDAYRLHLDLRHRTGHASGGVFPEPGQVGNLPSGEAYVVPYEGEIPGDPSRSAGTLPVQLGDEVLLYRVEGNRAVAVAPVGAPGPAAAREAALIAGEPAYRNLAELGLGVLSGFGVEPTGEVLLDEKLGLHVAFGRSDHFGGTVGPADFSGPDAVVHIDRVFVPAMQPRVSIASADLVLPDRTVALIRDDAWVV
ncbi:MAG: hypothetical protein FJ087_09830, partial [Deltaproteobacteria bacterium]|nr:hypothetical protein [Deltaproteobacteria bacterium]